MAESLAAHLARADRVETEVRGVPGGSDDHVVGAKVTATAAPAVRRISPARPGPRHGPRAERGRR